MSVRVERAGDAAILTIDRPETKNALDRATVVALGEAVRVAAAEPSVRGVVLTGSGDSSFVSGGDIRELAPLAASGAGPDEVLSMFERMAILETCEVPVIAAVQGDVHGGGCELLLLCDMVIIEEHASLAFKHAKMGLSPAWGGLTRLVERVGPLEAARVLFTAERVGAAEALRIGLVNEVVPKGRARAAAAARVNRIADNPRSAVAAMKGALRAVREARRGEAILREREVFSSLWGGEEHVRAMTAFLARKPR